MSKPAAYYNEIDPYAAQWLRNLIVAGLIAPGDVDERSIEDVHPYDLRGYRQCHFFAGIGVWSHALRQAGWEDDREVWTGSCPCQPFSTAGEGKGFADERHLWPAWHHLIEQCRPAVVFGEQVASKDGLAWIDLVSSDMEAQGYAFGGLDLCAAGVGAPHIRQRLYWVADNNNNGFGRIASPRLYERWEGTSGEESQARKADWSRGNDVVRRGKFGRLGHNNNSRLEGLAGDGNHVGRQGRFDALTPGSTPPASTVDGKQSGPVNGHWRDSDWIFCGDRRWRAVEPGTFPLADGPAARVGRLRAYGNAIVAPLAQAFIEAYRDVTEEL